MKRPRLTPRCARVAAIILASLAAREAAASSWTGHAVLVGVADYQGHVDDLFYADDDAADVRDTLLLDAEHWSESNVEMILNSDATFDEIRAAVERMRTASATTDDVCVFFFSGHGDYWLDAPPYDEPDGEDETLVAYDVDIYDDDLAAWLSGFTTQRVCVIIDTCYAGGMAKSADGTSAADWVAGMAADIARVRPTGIVKSPAGGTSRWSGPAPAGGTSRWSGPAPVPGTKDIDDLATVNVVALMACEDVEAAEEDALLRNGVFTFYVVEAMRRLETDTNLDAICSAEEIFAYASEPTFLWNPMQTPFLLDSDSDPQRQVPVITAADRHVEPVVTEEDLPFGGGMKAGCLPAGASRTGRGPVSRSAPLGLLAALAFVLGIAAGRRRAFAVIGLLALAAGCFQPYPSDRHAYAKAGGALPEGAGRSPPLAAAAGARSPGAGPHTSKVRPAGAPSVMPVAREADTDRFLMGIRAGLLVPVRSRNAPYSETVQAGIFAAGRLRGVPFEIGLDFFRLESRTVDVTADVLSGRVDVIAVRRVTYDDQERYYHFGPRILVDFVSSRTYWDGTSEVAAALGAGVGIRRRGGGWDARLSVDALLGSFNMAGLLKLDAGFRF